MPYPKSPFSDDFDDGILWKLGGDDDESTVNEVSQGLVLRWWQNCGAKFQVQNETVEWLCTAPEITTFRVNTLKAAAGEVRDRIEKHMRISGDVETVVEIHARCDDAIIVYHPVSKTIQFKIYKSEIIVDPTCAAAVLRGAHIYAPGVMAMMTGTQVGDHVSIYADLDRKCKKGFSKLYEGKKCFIGNGIVRMTRNQLFCENPQTGIAVQLIETTSNCPPTLGDDFLPQGVALLQNLPSIICVHVLKPFPNDVILDMCASPGNKTTHIAALLRNQGRLVAVAKTPAKVAQLKSRCDKFGAQVEVIQADSTKLLENNFKSESFDKILLDAPCSALGKRPQLINTTSAKVLRSYVPLQRKLFETAVQLLKTNGVLIYSTCTITVAENEGIVAWALKKFNLELEPAEPIFGGPGLTSFLSEEESKKVQRFGPNQCIDSVGFFIAKFVKTI